MRAKQSIGVRTYVILWAGSVFVSLLILSGGWLIGRHSMSRMQERVLTDARALDSGRLLELAVLGERREDLLWLATGDEEHREQRDAEMRAARDILPALQAYATSAEEQAIVEGIVARLEGLKRYQAQESPAGPVAKAAIVDDLLSAVDSYEAQNKAQLAETIQAARQLQSGMTRWLAALMIAVTLILVAGVFGVVRRVVRPALALTRAAEEFGKGNFAVRLEPLHEDELGRLALTFNNMADDIASREERRVRFMGTVAHDLRNPIVGIALAARAIKRNSRDNEDVRQWFDVIETNTRRLEAMAKDLTDNVQVASGKLHMRAEEVELGALMRHLTDECATMFENHSVVFQGDQDCFVRGDPDRLERVALNLISNAVKYSPKGTTVRVSVTRRGAEVVLAVTDEGPGISADDMAVIFQPFGRGEGAHTMAKGAGLGLFVVKQIVAAHDGRIDVESASGCGTTVVIALPALETRRSGERD